MKNTPLPHDCGRVLDIKWISATRVNYHCSICNELIAWSDVQPDLSLKINVSLPAPRISGKKIYPKAGEALYNPLNIEQWK